MVKWLGGGISEAVIAVSSPVSYNPYQARSALN